MFMFSLYRKSILQCLLHHNSLFHGTVFVLLFLPDWFVLCRFTKSYIN